MADFSLTGQLPRRAHVCALNESDEDVAGWIPLFIRAAREQREQVVTVAGAAWLKQLRKQLDRLDLQSIESTQAEQLLLVAWTQIYSHSKARFDLRTALRSIEQFYSSAIAERGWAGLRLLEQMDWVVSASGGSREVADYERGVDRLVGTYAQPAVCVYNLSRLSGLLLIELLSSHGFVMLRGELVESPFYMEPS